jgi:hypothetical protein
MSYLKLKTTSGGVADFPIYHPQFSNDGKLIFFEGHINGAVIYTKDEEVKPLVLKTTDMSAEDWTKMIATIASIAGTGGVFGGPVGIAIGAVVGAAAFFWKRPTQNGYYLITDKENANCILTGIIYKSSVY